MLITILGPTASGKTRYAVRLAQEIGGEIISADSRQVYRRMDIGTGKDLADYTINGDSIPYHLIDIAEPGERYNLYRYVNDFHVAYNDIVARGKTPILCGGTGLYIEGVLGGYYHEAVPCERIIGLDVSRELRRQRITERLHARLNEGMIEEVRALIEQDHVPIPRLLAYGLEYRFVTRHILGELSLPAMTELLEIAIHQFAKRQMTWFRGMERRGYTIEWVK